MSVDFSPVLETGSVDSSPRGWETKQGLKENAPLRDPDLDSFLYCRSWSVWMLLWLEAVFCLQSQLAVLRYEDLITEILLVYQYVFSLQLFLAYGFDRLIEIIYRSNHGRRGCEKR